uniref:Uncharacterized protein LOC105049636 n=1 Tax=Elaeis guineensis var. tenera TaxID=51953 RepID=A0A8N4F7C5_ELAGV|nr:uncharacterized protein LOC105049636 [Elaeis guineensis]
MIAWQLGWSAGLQTTAVASHFRNSAGGMMDQSWTACWSTDNLCRHSFEKEYRRNDGLKGSLSLYYFSPSFLSSKAWGFKTTWGKPWLELTTKKDLFEEDLGDYQKLIGIHISQFKNLLIKQGLYDASISHVDPQQMKLTFDDIMVVQVRKGKKKLGSCLEAEPSKRKKSSSSSPPRPQLKSSTAMVVSLDVASRRKA